MKLRFAKEVKKRWYNKAPYCFQVYIGQLKTGRAGGVLLVFLCISFMVFE
ncbi:hypothetical protein ABIE50_003944 [Chitinophaga sp. OAE865]